MKLKSISWPVLALALMAGAAQAQVTASGTLNAKLINKSGIWLIFNSDPAGVTLGSAGTAAASLDFGTVAMYMSTPPAGVTLTRTATNFTISSPFDVYVDQGGNPTSTSYRIQANLSAAPGAYTFKIDAVTLSTTAATLSNTATYRTNLQHTLFLTIPATAPAGVVSNTVNFTVTAN